MALVAFWAAVTTSTACPVCNTETGQQVRAGIFGKQFVWNVMAVMAPVPLLLISAFGVSHWLGKEGSTDE